MMPLPHFWDIKFNYLLTLKTWHWLTAGKPSREAATYLSVLNLIRIFFGALNFCKAFKTLQAFEDSQHVKRRKKTVMKAEYQE